MLTVQQLENLKQRDTLIEQFDPNKSTWLVSDLGSKSLLQQTLLKKYDYLPEDAVLRANELWQKILKYNFPHTEIVSQHFAIALITNWLKKQDFPIAKKSGTADLLFKYIHQFLPILCQDNLIEMKREWLRTNPDALLRWGMWFELSVRAWQYFCAENILAQKWVGAFLSGQDDVSASWRRNLIVDIGADFAGVEVELFKKFSIDKDVCILSPQTSWLKKYNATLWPYTLLLEQNDPTISLPIEFSVMTHNSEVNDESLAPTRNTNKGTNFNIICRRYTTQISEVKSAVGQVRAWLDKGLLPQQIAVLAADIEQYWTPLHTYFEFEGIPVNKDRVMRAISLPNVVKWASRLKIELKKIETGDLELSVFAKNQDGPLAYDKFSRLFSQIFDIEDLNRSEYVKNQFDFKIDAQESLTRNKFLRWALHFWSGDEFGIEKIYAEIMRECPTHIVLPASDWIDYLNKFVAALELKLSSGHPLGVNCTNLDSAQNLKFEKIIILGTSEAEMKTFADIAISVLDIKKIAQDIGVQLDLPDQDYNEFLADKIIASASGETHLTFSATSYSGRVQSPALIWMRNAHALNSMDEKVSSPELTRLDEVQELSPFGEEQAIVRECVLRDLGQAPREIVTPPNEIIFSATQIEKYTECPFIFAAEKLFGLSDLPNVDLDLDSMSRGRLLHGLLEQLTTEPMRYQYSTAEIARILDELIDKIGIVMGEPRLWVSFKQRYIETAQRFLKFEKEWRAQHPKTKTLARELRIQGELQLASDVSIKVTGQIDRVDTLATTDNNEAAPAAYVAIDYKSTAFGLHGHASWLKQNEYQLLFYSLALKEGLTQLPAAEVYSAVYYVLANMKRDKGFKLIEGGADLYDLNTAARSNISREKLNELFINTKAQLLEVIKQIQAGRFAPEPADKSQCYQCNWRTLCRAPHLN